MRSLKPGKVVIVLGGRFAGKKAVIVQNVDQGSNNRRFGHALIAGIDRYPLKVTKSMSKRVLARRSRIKPFVKAVNYNHLMPTRYALDLGEGVKTAVPMDAGSNPTARSKARKEAAVHGPHDVMPPSSWTLLSSQHRRQLILVWQWRLLLE